MRVTSAAVKQVAEGPLGNLRHACEMRRGPRRPARGEGGVTVESVSVEPERGVAS
jgi:hypothetical protein